MQSKTRFCGGASMAAETDGFVIATFALWAGDTQYADERLAEYSPLHSRPLATLTSLNSPEELIATTAALRRRQLATKTREFKKIVSQRSDELGSLTEAPFVLQTDHLRATIYRRTSRQFSMRGYLRDLDWEPRLLELARKAGNLDSARLITSQPKLLKGPESYGPLGASWAVEGSLFIEIDVTELGQIEANGVWTKLELPTGADAITKPFEAVLRSLDFPVNRGELSDPIVE